MYNEKISLNPIIDNSVKKQGFSFYQVYTIHSILCTNLQGFFHVFFNVFVFHISPWSYTHLTKFLIYTLSARYTKYIRFRLVWLCSVCIMCEKRLSFLVQKNKHSCFRFLYIHSSVRKLFILKKRKQTLMWIEKVWLSSW